MVFSSTYSSAAVKLGIRRKMVNGMFHKLKIEKGANLQQKIFYCSVFPDPRKWKFQTSFDGLFSEAKGLYTMAWYPCCGRGLGKRGHKQLEILPFNYGFHLVILHLFSNLLWAVIPWIQILAQLTGWFSVLNVSSSWISPHWLACLLTWLWHQSENLTSSLHLSLPPSGSVTFPGCLDPRPDTGCPGRAYGHIEGRASGQRSGGWGGSGSLTAPGPCEAGGQ